jgi:hypothetical protein
MAFSLLDGIRNRADQVERASATLTAAMKRVRIGEAEAFKVPIGFGKDLPIPSQRVRTQD